MINFFRQIRQKSLTGSKSGKYFLYAVGEIILVVVGILIALYINNESQRNLRDEQYKIALDQIYTHLKCDLDAAVWDLERVQEQREVCDSLIMNQLEVDELQLLKTLHYLDWYPGSGFVVSNFDYYIERLQYSPLETSKSSLVFHISAFYNLMHNGFQTDYNLTKIKYFSPILTEYEIPVAGKVNLINIFEEVPFQASIYSQDILNNLRILSGTVGYSAALASTHNRIVRLEGLIQFRIGEIESLMHMIRSFEPDIMFRFDQIEIIGTGLEHDNGAPVLMSYNDQNNTWYIKSKFIEGGISFTSSFATYLTWGKDKTHHDSVKFWGEDIQVEEGVYLITLDLAKMQYSLEKE